MANQPNYSALDRLLHRIAFGAPSIQMAAADIEDKLFRDVLKDVEAPRPVFITSLPRAGTTLLLEALNLCPELATHTYRDMPFVLSPLLWSRLSGAFQKRAELNERAHGDGMQVGYDSPEAFEEILWRTFWPEKYGEDRIALWSRGDFDDDARDFFVEHMRKVIALRCPENTANGRYLSKNNGNIARLDLIGTLFPDAAVLLPFRHPLAHAASLLRQHLNFIEQHREAPFVRRYMADIGHYEFGALHRPIAFPGLDDLFRGRDPLTLDYWLAYWIAAFDYVLSRPDLPLLISYERTCEAPRETLCLLSDKLGLASDAWMPQAAALFKAPSSGKTPAVNGGLRERAEGLHQELLRAALA